MRCEDTRSRLNAYSDGELPQELRRTVESHLAACRSCRELLEAMRGMDELFQGTLPVPPVPEGLTERIMAGARERRSAEIPERRFPSWTWNPVPWLAELSVPMRLAAGVTVLVALAAGVYLDGRNSLEGNTLAARATNLYGLEWFAPAPPGSIGSIYLALADPPPEKGLPR